MKILLVIPHYSFHIFGAVKPLLKDLSRGLARRGHQADVLSLYIDKFWEPQWKKEVFHDDGVKVIRWPSINPLPRAKDEKSNLLNIINCGAIPSPGFRKLEREYDIINFFDMIDLSFPFFSLFNNIPKIHYCITLSEQFKFYKERALWKHILAITSDYHLASTRQSLGLLRELGIKEERSDYLYHGVDTEVFKPDYESKKDNTVLFLSRIEQRKGLKTLLEAMPFVKNKVKLLIVGQVADDAYFKEVLELIDAEVARGYHEIRYTGPVEEKQKPALYQSAALYVLPSIYEDFGIVNIEALACGTPVVASRVGGVPEVVEDRVDGIIFEAGNAAELAAAIDKLMSDRELRRKFGEEGRKIVLEKFSWDRIIERLENIYYRVIDIHNRRGL